MAGGSSELPDDVLGTILRRVAAADLVRCLAVCRRWSSAVRRLHRERLEQTFPLYISPQSKTEVNLCDVSDPKTVYSVPFSLAGAQTLGSSHGWAIIVDYVAQLHLVNPLTGARITLPPFSAFGFVETDKEFELLSNVDAAHKFLETGDSNYLDLCYLTKYIFHFSMDKQRADRKGRKPLELILGEEEIDAVCQFLYYKAFISNNPATGDYTVAVVHGNCGLSIVRNGEAEWTTLERQEKICDITFCRRRTGQLLLYSIGSRGRVLAWDLALRCPRPEVVVPKLRSGPGQGECRYIVRMPRGETLHVTRKKVFDRVCPEAFISVRPIDLGTGRLLAATRSLRGHALFLGVGHSLCLSGNDFPQVNTDCVYLMPEHGPLKPNFPILLPTHSDKIMGIYNLTTAEFTAILPREEDVDWLNLVWFTPNIA